MRHCFVLILEDVSAQLDRVTQADGFRWPVQVPACTNVKLVGSGEFDHTAGLWTFSYFRLYLRIEYCWGTCTVTSVSMAFQGRAFEAHWKVVILITRHEKNCCWNENVLISAISANRSSAFFCSLRVFENQLVWEKQKLHVVTGMSCPGCLTLHHWNSVCVTSTFWKRWAAVSSVNFSYAVAGLFAVLSFERTTVPFPWPEKKGCGVWGGTEPLPCSAPSLSLSGLLSPRVSSLCHI